MRTTSNAASNPWGTNIDDGWRDLVVSSAPPPPPREAVEPPAKNATLPADITTWQEHGAARADAVVDQPSFTAGDRRLWVIAGTLMALAALVLGLLGVLTFGGPSLADASAAAGAVTPATAAAPSPSASAPGHAVAPVAVAAAVKPSANGPRTLKRTKHARHHKRIAAR